MKKKPGGWRRSFILACHRWICPTFCTIIMLGLLAELCFLLEKDWSSEAMLQLEAEQISLPRIRSNLNNLDMPHRRVQGRSEPCLKLLDEESLEWLEFPLLNTSSSPELCYRESSGEPVSNKFTGDQSLAERNSSFQAGGNTCIHCGFYERNSGFEMDQRDTEFLSSCEAVVSTCIFGGRDDLYQPIGMTNNSLSKVCYVAFWDEVTLSEMPEDKLPEKSTRMAGLWRVVIVRNLPFTDQRRNGKIPKMLGHRLFPRSKYSIWVDSKYQFRRDPLGVFQALLWSPGAPLAISEHGARNCVYKEGEAVVAKHKASPGEVEIQLSQYKLEGFPRNATFYGRKALAEASVIVREHTPATNRFMCLWFNEVTRFTARDQLSFPYVLRRFGELRVNMIHVCTRKALVNSIGHKQKAKELETPEESDRR